MRVKIFFTLLIIIGNKVFSQPIPTDFKKAVVFIYFQAPNGELTPDGTGFYMTVADPVDTTKAYPILVTAKHVLKNQDGSLVSNILVRANTKDSNRYVLTKLVYEGRRKNVFFHSDSSVDLAVIIGSPTKSDYEIQYLTQNFLIDRDEYKNIAEGTEAFFVGLFTSFIGQKKNFPIFRFGHVAVVSNERVLFDNMKREMTIVETNTYGGNSGSPIFYRIFLNEYTWTYKLGGLINGFFGNLTPLQVVNTGTNVPVSTQNIGIAAVTPSYLLLDIVHSVQFKNEISELFKR